MYDTSLEGLWCTILHCINSVNAFIKKMFDLEFWRTQPQMGQVCLKRALNKILICSAGRLRVRFANLFEISIED